MAGLGDTSRTAALDPAAARVVADGVDVPGLEEGGSGRDRDPGTSGLAPSVRIGLHAAEANRRGDDYSGMAVQAARVAALAEDGEIVATTETLASVLAGAPSFPLPVFGELALGVHSYLTYLRDRLLLARDLLTE